MKTTTIFQILAAAASLTGQSNASPISIFGKRQAGEIFTTFAGIIKSILEGAGLAFPEDSNAWEYDKLPGMCAINFSTEDGGNCKASVTCNDGVTKDYNDWNVCYVGGRQYFTDDRIGDFSITFTQKDGSEGEGLTDPVLQLKYVGDWTEFPVSDLAHAKYEADDCEDHNGANCPTGPFVCGYGNTGNSYIWDSRYKPWVCGMPRVGLDFGEGDTPLDSDGPTNEAGFAPGWCGVHVTQYQKPDPAVDSYSLSIQIFDANQDLIGDTNGQVSSASPVSLPSKLPWMLIVSTGGIDDDPVSFAYADQTWDSNETANHHCSVGAFDSGSRQMDCGFSC